VIAGQSALIADAILAAHAGYVLFVVGGQAMILVGWRRRWQWTRGRVFRVAHLVAIGLVVWEAWAGVACPLTVWESRYRELAGAGAYPVSFMAYWLRELIFYSAPDWVFTLIYTVFSLIVVASYLLNPPRARQH
jgi:polyferredoxin